MPFPNSVVYPLNFINRKGIPLIESAGVETTATQVIITIANRAFHFLGDRGVFLFRLNQALPTGNTLPIIFSWTEFSQTFTQPLTLVNNEPTTAAQLTGSGVYMIYYDKVTNLLQLMTIGVSA